MSEHYMKRKPRVVALGHPKYVGKDYLEKFKEDFEFEVLDATNRVETKSQLPAVAASGPIDAFLIRMGTPPYEPFDQDLLGPLLPGCKIIVSASAGYVSNLLRHGGAAIPGSWLP